ncbi:MAG: hypothetical protein JXA42_08375 [Anaerolineales bacterium]|nr:hypothetical protein [Anaerolineales bacterium]
MRILLVVLTNAAIRLPHFTFFARSGFTPAAQDYATERSVLLIDLSRLDRDLD